MVTSKGVGLAVPDWPTTFGYNMFFFPVSKWVGGIFFEHTHRLIASTVGLLTDHSGSVALALRNRAAGCAYWASLLLGAVILQGVLGGLRVTMLKDQIGIFHACLAQAFFGLLVIIALVTSQFWREPSSPFAIAKRAASDCTPHYRPDLYSTGARCYHATSTPRSFHHWISQPPTANGFPTPVRPQSRRLMLARDRTGMSDVSAAQIWLQMAHRFGAVLVVSA